MKKLEEFSEKLANTPMSSEADKVVHLVVSIIDTFKQIQDLPTGAELEGYCTMKVLVTEDVMREIELATDKRSNEPTKSLCKWWLRLSHGQFNLDIETETATLYVKNGKEYTKIN